MTTFTSRGVPLAESTDPADIAARLNPVAQLQHDRPGVSPLTTTQRNALTGVELWDGRLILNTATDRINRYDAGTLTWVAVADSSEVAALLATTGTPAQDAATASRGVSGSAARADHIHPTAPWQAWTPTVYGSTLGNGTRVARYAQIGKIVHLRFFETLGSTSSFSGSQLGFSLPVLANIAAAVQTLSLTIYTTGTSFTFGAALIQSGTGNDRAMGYVSAGSWTGAGMAVGSHWTVVGTYEAA